MFLVFVMLQQSLAHMGQKMTCLALLFIVICYLLLSSSFYSTMTKKLCQQMIQFFRFLTSSGEVLLFNGIQQGLTSQSPIAFSNNSFTPSPVNADVSKYGTGPYIVEK